MRLCEDLWAKQKHKHIKHACQLVMKLHRRRSELATQHQAHRRHARKALRTEEPQPIVARDPFAGVRSPDKPFLFSVHSQLKPDQADSFSAADHAGEAVTDAVEAAAEARAEVADAAS